MSRKMAKNFAEYNDDLCMVAISKENVKRISFSTLIIFLTGVVFLLLSNVPAITVINNKTYTAAGIISMVFSVVSLLATRYLVTRRLKDSYKSLSIFFWCGLIVVAEIYGLSAMHTFGALLPVFIIIATIGMVPYFHRLESLLISGIQVVGIMVLVLFDKISYSEIIYCILFIMLSVGTSAIRFNNYKLNFKYKSKLNAAIRQSETDRLTALLNRRGLERGVYDLWESWIENKTNIAVIMLDIDFFKKYNDTFGHQQGDRCIRSVADEISAAVRKNIDFAARVGGEEFLICLTDIEAKHALTWIRRLKSNIEDLRLEQSPKNFLPYVTVSMGLVTLRPTRSITFDDLYKMADEQLYTAKENGRACFVYKNKVYDQRTRSDYTVLAKVANFDNRYRI